MRLVCRYHIAVLLHFFRNCVVLIKRCVHMQFQPFVYDKNRQRVPVTIEPMSPQDAISTGRDPRNL